MTPDARRRLGALAALAIGIFLGLTLLHGVLPITGRVGDVLGERLWGMLGVGALALPILGIALALAGFERLGPLDMKRAAILIAGLGILVPFLVGVLGRVTRFDLDQRDPLGSLTGWLPGLLAIYVPQYVGIAGAVLLGFVALSALTLITFQWHPLQRLEQARELVELVEGVETERPAKRRKAEKPEKAPAVVVIPDVEDDEDEAPLPRLRKEKKPKPAKASKAAPGEPEPEDDELPPVEILASPPDYTDDRATRSTTSSGSRCSIRSAPSRSKAASPAGRRGRS